MQAIPSFGGFYHPALHRTASQLISQREAARKVPNFAQPKFSIRNLRLSKSPLPPFGRLLRLIRGPINFKSSNLKFQRSLFLSPR